ncbi:glycosyltransferase family 2 protein [bacterium]|nr:glycosyltransferase family 2 protein [bacterium]
MVAAPNKSNICAVVVTYHPDNNFPKRLLAVASQIDAVVIVDNASGEDAVETLRNAVSDVGAHILQNPKNIGIASALNRGVIWAKEHGYDWVLTLDQDTILLDDDVVGTFADVYDSCGMKLNIACIGSNYIDKLQEKPFIDEKGEDDEPWADAPTVITSGTLLSIAAAEKIGPFRDEFFIDHVDDEYCLRARRFDFVCIMTRRPLMVHTSGAPRYHEFRGRRLITSHLPAIRRYYRTRNLVTLIREYRHTNPDWIRFAVTVRYKETLLMLLFERDKFQKTLAVLLGIFHGLIGRTGPLNKK